MEIIYAGDSHYGIGGYRSLFQYFDKIFLIKDNQQDILNAKRDQDIIIDDFDSVDCKTVFLCGYSKLITEDQLKRKTYINVHGALLPKYRGMNSTFYAIMNDEKEFGITFHLVNQYMNAGDIIAQFSFRYNGQTVAEINASIDELVYQHAGDVINKFVTGNIQPVPQDDEKATYGAKRNLHDCLIDFSMTNELIRRFFKALTPSYPYPMLSIKGDLYEILPGAQVIDREYFGPLGRAVFIDKCGVWIKTKEGFLVVDSVRKYGYTEKISLAKLVSIGYRFLQVGGVDRESLEEVDNAITNYVYCNDEVFPERWKKILALFYPDARIRKKYLKSLNIDMQEGTYANLGLCTDATSNAPVVIGKNVSIAPGVCFITNSSPNNSKTLSNVKYVNDNLIKEEPIIIEDDVWVGAHVTILPGVRIGKCSIIGAGAVVLNDVEEYSIYAGVPAKKIRKILDENRD